MHYRILKSFHCHIQCLHLHRNEETLYVSCSTSVVTSINIRSGVQLLTFDPYSHRDHKRISCTLTPCGSTLITACASTVQGWNLLTGKKTIAYSIPLHSETDQHNYISSIDYHPQNFMISITIYGTSQDAGVLVLDHIEQSIPKQLPTPHSNAFPSTEKTLIASRQSHQQNLGSIIQRIDDIFRLPQNRTDDLKSRSTSRTANTYVIEAASEESAIELKNMSTSHRMSLKRCDTFTVDEVIANSRTFSISGAARGTGRNSGTFNVAGGGDKDDDDTTVSESM